MIRSMLAALTAALLLATPTSVFAAPKPDALFGGGLIGAKSGGAADADVAWLGARIDKTDVNKLTFFADVSLKCGGGNAPTLVSVEAKDVVVGPDASFTATVPHTNAGELGTQQGTVTITGRVAADHRITGKIAGQADVALKSGKTYTCAAPSRSYAIFDMTNPAAKAARKAGGSYAGSTAAGFSSLLRLTSSGKGVAKAATQANLKCEKAKDGVFSFETMPGKFIKFGKGGRFSGVEKFDSPRAYITPAFSKLTWTLNGRFLNGRLSGAWRVSMKVYDAANRSKLIDTCTAAFSWKAALV